MNKIGHRVQAQQQSSKKKKKPHLFAVATVLRQGELRVLGTCGSRRRGWRLQSCSERFADLFYLSTFRALATSTKLKKESEKKKKSNLFLKIVSSLFQDEVLLAKAAN